MLQFQKKHFFVRFKELNYQKKRKKMKKGFSVAFLEAFVETSKELINSLSGFRPRIFMPIFANYSESKKLYRGYQ